MQRSVQSCGLQDSAAKFRVQRTEREKERETRQVVPSYRGGMECRIWAEQREPVPVPAPEPMQVLQIERLSCKGKCSGGVGTIHQAHPHSIRSPSRNPTQRNAAMGWRRRSVRVARITLVRPGGAFVRARAFRSLSRRLFSSANRADEVRMYSRRTNILGAARAILSVPASGRLW